MDVTKMTDEELAQERRDLEHRLAIVVEEQQHRTRLLVERMGGDYGRQANLFRGALRRPSIIERLFPIEPLPNPVELVYMKDEEDSPA